MTAIAIESRRTTSLRVGAASIWLSIVVLLPAGGHRVAVGPRWMGRVPARGHVQCGARPFRVTLTISIGVTLVNAVFGLLVAWVLVRDSFPASA